MNALISGSVAYDHIMVFPDRFARHILPDRIHMLNVSFRVPEMRREFGGCAGNIAYSLNQLAPGRALPMGTAGRDFEPYARWLEENGIDRKRILVVAETYTAQAFITTDLDDNQITAFHPGAMDYAHRNRIDGQERDVRIGTVSPNGRQGMLDHACQFAEAGLPFLFDPGQGTPMFDGKELRQFVDQATWLCANDYEWGLIHDRTGLNERQTADRLQALVVTRGAQGSTIYTNKRQYDVPAVAIPAVVDPTGCGDAYRAGLLYGLLHEMDWETAGRLASLLGAIAAGSPGTQNHRCPYEECMERFQASFGYRP